MALQTLKGIKKVGNFDIISIDELREQYPEKFNESGIIDFKWFKKEIKSNYYVILNHDTNNISFNIQNGPIKENGINGCQVDTIIEIAMLIIKGLNNIYSCEENIIALKHLDEALLQLNKRKKDRENRGVEGFNKK